MNASLWLSALIMGWAGSPHCLAMCGPACALQARPSEQWAFQAGRLFGYALAGALAGASMQAVGAWSVQVQSLRPLWAFVHMLFALMGLWMLWRGDQPGFLLQGAAGLWRWVQSRVSTGSSRSGWPKSLVLGLIWVLWPCGLLYSALTLAALSGTVANGALTMALFALGGGVAMGALPWVWQRLRASRQGLQSSRLRQVGIRLAGAVLASMSGWALWQGLVMDQAPWCITPA